MVNIYEQAIKPTVDLEDGVTVYVPGYSTIGPEGPTLCSSVSEFEGLFGSTPYLFEEDEIDPVVSKGSPEKGYLYAKSLLSSGLKVLFHRVNSGAETANCKFSIRYGDGSSDLYNLEVRAISFGIGYQGIKLAFVKMAKNLYNLVIWGKDGDKVSEELISLDPKNSRYLKLMNSPWVKFREEGDKDIEDSKMLKISSLGYEATIVNDSDSSIELGSGYTTNDLVGKTLTLGGLDESEAQFSLKGMMTKLKISEGKNGLLYPLLDFEKYPSVAYLTSGGYYVDTDVASTLMKYAAKISAIALIDMDENINDESSWLSAKATLSSISGTTTEKGKSAHFCGCNSFNISPYRIVLGDSFNYLKCLGENMKRGVAPWLPVANDPNGVSPLGYDTTQKISTSLAETMAEGEVGVSSNPIIYSTSAGGYKIMGNRTLLSNDGVLSPNSFLNIAVIVNRVARSARQTANKLKIVSTDPNGTFLKFKQSVSKTIEPMVVNQDGVLEYKIRHLPKTAPATINIQIHLVVLEGIEKFNIYIPYELKLD